MSRTVIPPAYRLMIASSRPPRRRGPLGTRRGGEGARAVPRSLQRHVPDLAGHRLRGGPIPAVRAPAPGRITALISQMAGQFGGQAELEDGLDHLGQEPARTGAAPAPAAPGHLDRHLHHLRALCPTTTPPPATITPPHPRPDEVLPGAGHERPRTLDPRPARSWCTAPRRAGVAVSTSGPPPERSRAWTSCCSRR
jgi:hypothetical protein